MKLLVVSATLPEIEPFLKFFNFCEGLNVQNGNEITVLVSGVGMVATAFAMGKELNNGSLYDYVINAGIAGSFTRELQLGDVVTVASDCFAELGAEDGDGFLSIDEMGFGQSTFTPRGSSLTASLNLPVVRGITVNKVHGRDESIRQLVHRLDPDIETMEGAAFFYACNMAGVPCVQIRSVSNYIERRNRAAWQIPLAVKNLNSVLIGLFKEIL